MSGPKSGPLFTALVELQGMLKRNPINDRYTRALTKQLRERAVEHAIDLIQRGCSRVDAYFKISRKEVIAALETFGPHESDLIAAASTIYFPLEFPHQGDAMLRSAHYAGLVHAALSTFGSLNDALHSPNPGRQLTPTERAHFVQHVLEKFGVDFTVKVDIEPDTVRAPRGPALTQGDKPWQR